MSEFPSHVRPPLEANQPEQNASEWEPAKLLDPFLTEYDSTIKFLMDEIEKYKGEQSDLKEQIMKLINDNKRLAQELKENIEIQMASGKKEGMERIEILENQLRTVSEAKTTLLEMWHIALSEIERLEQLLHEKRDGLNTEAIEERISQVKEQYVRALSVLNSELSETRNELRNTKNELNSKNSHLNEMKKDVENTKELLNLKERELSSALSEKQEAVSKALSIEAELADSMKRIIATSGETSQLKQKIEDIQGFLVEVTKQNAELKTRESASLKEAKESLVTAENAVLEKEESSFREQQALKEIQQLKSSIKQLVEQAVSQANSEVENIKKRYNEKIQLLMEEIQALELDNSEKQTQVERALREKRAAETELEKLYRENSHSDIHSTPLFEDLCHRLTQAEHFRDEAQLKVQSLETELKRLQISYEQEIVHYRNECKSLKSRLHQLQSEFTTTATEKVYLVDQVEKLEQQCRVASEELTTVKKKLQKDMTAAEQRIQQQQEEHSEYLQHLEHKYQAAISELRSLLDAQLRMSNKWKEEASELTIRFEAKLKDMYEELSSVQSQNAELKRILTEEKERRVHAERKATYYAEEMNKQQMQLRERS